ncbi:hypothetical protein [Candidatus Clostridium radicumherbarum]|uniref:Uncharacterized protein n=1 Tax=Candidatus Clostridium radicumherbarum TaxID=3381662 RepID=A0ABW8TP99_9CLOT
MSRRRNENCEEKNTFFGMGNCCCDFSTLIILILIILQFNRRRDFFGITSPIASEEDCGTSKPQQTIFGSNNLIDNSILFIIALFFLACCNPCREY